MPCRRSQTILAVEDNPDSAALIGYVLDSYRVRVAGTVAGGLLLARRHWFDLYLLDASLPDGSGIDLCKAIRQFDPNAPIIISSAAGPLIEPAAREAGAQRFLHKPVDPTDLDATVGSMLGEVRMRAAQARMLESSVFQDEARRSAERAERHRQRSADGLVRAERAVARANYKLARWKAYCAFEYAGGTRAQFRRLWPAVRRNEPQMDREFL